MNFDHRLRECLYGLGRIIYERLTERDSYIGDHLRELTSLKRANEELFKRIIADNPTYQALEALFLPDWTKPKGLWSRVVGMTAYMDGIRPGNFPSYQEYSMPYELGAEERIPDRPAEPTVIAESQSSKDSSPSVMGAGGGGGGGGGGEGTSATREIKPSSVQSSGSKQVNAVIQDLMSKAKPTRNYQLLNSHKSCIELSIGLVKYLENDENHLSEAQIKYLLEKAMDVAIGHKDATVRAKQELKLNKLISALTEQNPVKLVEAAQEPTNWKITTTGAEVMASIVPKR